MVTQHLVSILTSFSICAPQSCVNLTYENAKMANLNGIFTKIVFLVVPDDAFLEVDALIHTICGPYEQSWMNGVYALLRYAPYFITIILYVASFYYKQIYLFFVGIGLSLDGYVNSVINERIPTRPRVETCAPLWGSTVSYEVQNAAFFTTFVVGYMSLYQPRTKLWHITLVFIYFSLTISGAHFMHFHFSNAISDAAMIGAIDALVWQLLLHWILVPRLSLLLRARLIAYWGYVDTMVLGNRVSQHVITLENFEDEFRALENSPLKERMREFIAKQKF